MTTLTQHSVLRYGAASLLPRGLAIFTAIALTPLALERLGPVEYAYWILATQIPSLMIAPDLGLGQGVINEMTDVHLREQSLRSQQKRLAGLVKLLAVVALVWFGLGTAVSVLYVLNVTSSDDAAWLLLTALAISLACFTSSIPATILARAQLAQELGHRALIWEGGSKIITLISSAATLLLFPNLLLLVLAYMLPLTAGVWLNALSFCRYEFGGAARERSPRLRHALAENRHVFKLGKYFVVLQICYVLSIALDPFLINALLSADDVTYFSVTRRPYEMLPLVVALFSTSLWPVFIRLRGAAQWRRLRVLTFGVTGFGGLAVAILGVLITFWAGTIYSFLGRGFVDPSMSDLLWVALHVTASAVVMVLTVYLNSASIVRQQAMVMVGATVLVVAVKLVSLSWGIHAFIAVSSASYVLAVALPISLLAVLHIAKGVKDECSRHTSRRSAGC